MTEDQPKVKIFSTPTCPWCLRAKQFFKEHHIAYEDLNVAKDDVAKAEMVERSGQMGVPVIMIGNKILVGFDQEIISKALGIKE